MNRTGIDWCDYTDNPVTGCLGPDGEPCPHCYAQKIAERFRGSKAWPQGFKPTFHPERLNDPAKIKKPQTVFICSMADLFGDWVPDEWIREVMNACGRAPQHTYIFLTKNPERYLRLKASLFMGNKWFGTTVTSQEDYHRVMAIRSLPEWVNRFISFEPLLGELDLDLDGIKQVIIGAQTNPTIEPDHFWIAEIEQEADRVGAKVFCKDSLAYLQGDLFRRELAWSVRK